MARLHGRKGAFYLGLSAGTSAAEPVAFLNKWSIKFATDKVEVTSFLDSNKIYVSGLPDASGDVAGFYDSATAQLFTAAIDGVARRFYLYPDNTGTQYWFGTAIIDFSVDGAIGSAVNVSGTWAAASLVSKVG